MTSPDDERVLVCAPLGRDRVLVCELLTGVGVGCVACEDGETLAAELARGAGALLLTAEALSPPVVRVVAQAIAGQPAWSDLPLVLLLAQEQRLSAAAIRRLLGETVNLTLLARPTPAATLVTLCQSLVQARRRQYQVRELLEQLAAQNTALQREVAQRQESEVQREQLVRALARERAHLSELNETLEARVRTRTEQVRALAAQLSLAEHGERKRIAQILHDHVQQMLYGVQFRLHLIGQDRATSDPNTMHTYLAETKRLTEEAVQALRTLSVEMSPPVLQQEGLPEALAWLANQVREQHGLKVSLASGGDWALIDQHLRVVIYQMVRELLFNVVKHAGVDEAAVTLQQQQGQLHLTVADAGVGFDAADTASHSLVETGLGLATMQERLALFQGRMEVHSVPGQGTRITLTLPLPTDGSEAPPRVQ